MLKIGDFSKLSKISIRMLRHYDEIGLLHPQEIDDMTGYRYYSEAQLPEAGRIQMLKNLGFGLSMIREILESYEDAAELERFLTLKRQELTEQEVQKTVEGSYADTEHVRFKTVPAVEVASCTYKGGYEQISQVNAAVAKWIHDNGYEMSGLAFNIYHVSPYETQNPAEFVTEVCYPVRKCRV